MIAAVAFAVLASAAGPDADEDEARPETVPIGGYWRAGERRAPEPKDGRDDLLIGGFLLSVGILRAAVGVSMVYMARPAGCTAFQARFGIENCESVVGYGWFGAGLGSISLVTGIVLLARGGARRKAHQQWKLGAGPTGHGFQASLAWHF